jgi:hypothetical protein
MKALKIAAFVSVLLFITLHFIYEWYVVIENGGVLTNDMWLFKQYEMLSQYLATPIVLVYLYKRLK